MGSEWHQGGGGWDDDGRGVGWGEYLEAEPCLRPSPRASWEGQGLLDHLGSGLDCTCEYQQV